MVVRVLIKIITNGLGIVKDASKYTQVYLMQNKRLSQQIIAYQHIVMNGFRKVKQGNLKSEGIDPEAAGQSNAQVVSL
jgi:hypothetical protein